MTDSPEISTLRRFALRALAAAGVGAAVLLSWWWRVDEVREPDTVPAVAFGQTIPLGRSSITPQTLTFEDGQIILTSVVENITGTTQAGPFGVPAKLPELQIGDTILPEPELLLVRDQEELFGLQPRIPETVQMLWTAPEGWAPEQVRILLQKQSFKLRDNLYGQSSWLGFSPTGVLTATPEVTP